MFAPSTPHATLHTQVGELNAAKQKFEEVTGKPFDPPKNKKDKKKDKSKGAEPAKADKGEEGKSGELSKNEAKRAAALAFG